jgi:hypothetical protein
MLQTEVARHLMNSGEAEERRKNSSQHAKQYVSEGKLNLTVVIT